MSELIRQLLYPIGFVASMTFGGRFVWQWLVSEMRRESVVTRVFWQLSLIGNLLLWFHSLIQAQFHVCALQVCNGAIAWRNLNLMELSHRRWRFSSTCLLMIGFLIASTLLFISLNGSSTWFRIPITPWQDKAKKVSAWWHLVGCFGILLFSSRFWMQWWEVEKHKVSKLSLLFWWSSLIGQSLQLVYFAHIMDPVNVLGPTFALIPYIRNIMLLQQNPSQEIS